MAGWRAGGGKHRDNGRPRTLAAASGALWPKGALEALSKTDARQALQSQRSCHLEFQREHFRGPPEVFPRRLLVSLKHTHTHGSIVLALRNRTS